MGMGIPQPQDLRVRIVVGDQKESVAGHWHHTVKDFLKQQVVL
jgi:hypothetical protein